MTFDQSVSVGGLLVDLLTPLAILGIGFFLNKRFKHFERKMEQERRLTETRFELYREIAFKLNDIYAYFLFVGNWKDHTPHQIIAYKRELDRHVYAYKPIFSDGFFAKYNTFMLASFELFGGWRKDAKLRTNSTVRAEHQNPEFAECFTEEDNRPEIRLSYDSLLTCLATDLGVSSKC